VPAAEAGKADDANFRIFTPPSLTGRHSLRYYYCYYFYYNYYYFIFI